MRLEQVVGALLGLRGGGRTYDLVFTSQRIIGVVASGTEDRERVLGGVLGGTIGRVLSYSMETRATPVRRNYAGAAPSVLVGENRANFSAPYAELNAQIKGRFSRHLCVNAGGRRYRFVLPTGADRHFRVLLAAGLKARTE